MYFSYLYSSSNFVNNLNLTSNYEANLNLKLKQIYSKQNRIINKQNKQKQGKYYRE